MTNNSINVAEEFQLFKYAMIEENLPIQIDITKKLALLAKHLGEETTRNELLPFIHEHIDFHDEILLNLADQLKYFIPLVGGNENSKPVLELLVKLCNTDENLVRDKTIETLREIADSFDNVLMEEIFLPVLEKLANEEWFTSKCSAAALYSICYPKVSKEKKDELRVSFRILIQDDSPMVRKAAATACVDLIGCLEIEHIKNEFIAVFDNIAQDSMDSVKSTAVDIALALCKRLPQNEIEEFVLKTIESWCDDLSWRLRQRLALSLPEIQKVIPFAKTRGKVLGIYQTLSRDSEAEVRILVAKNLFKYCKSVLDSYTAQPLYENNFEPVFENSILPVIHKLLTDQSEDVRLALSSNFLSLSSLLSKSCLNRSILPLLTDVLENEPSISFQANTLQCLDCIPNNIDLTETLKSIKKVIRSIILNSHSNWRTRRTVLVALTHISRFSSKEYFTDNLKIFYIALLSDLVFAIRRTSSIILPLLADQYGIKWLSDNLIPYCLMFTKDSRYLYRYIPLFCICEIIRPSLRNKTESYLKDLELLQESTHKELQLKSLRMLARIVKLQESLENILNKQKYVDLLNKISETNGYTKDDIALYADETIEALTKTDVYSLKEEELQEGNCSYLEGVLLLIHSKFLKTLETLTTDVTENIRIRAFYTLDIIAEFLKSLKQELSQDWVKDSLSKIDPPELEIIWKQVEVELENTVQNNDDMEIIDTNLAVEHDESDTKPSELEQTLKSEEVLVQNNPELDSAKPENTEAIETKSEDQIVVENTS